MTGLMVNGELSSSLATNGYKKGEACWRVADRAFTAWFQLSAIIAQLALARTHTILRLLRAITVSEKIVGGDQLTRRTGP
jgi:hypothetical protein